MGWIVDTAPHIKGSLKGFTETDNKLELVVYDSIGSTNGLYKQPKDVKGSLNQPKF